MTPEDKQSELKRHRDLVLATIDYLLERYAGSIIYDQFDPVADYYKQQKLQTEKYYTQRRLDRLQQRFRSLTGGLQNRADLDFGSHIKEKTGYDIDIFEGLRNRIEIIIAQKEIRNQKELNDVGVMLRLYQQATADQERIDILKNLLVDFSKRPGKRKTPAVNNYLDNQLSEVCSPDGKCKLTVVKSGTEENALTYVAVEFEQASQSIYAAKGHNPDIKAYWRNNVEIVIETKKVYAVLAKYKQIQSFRDKVNIEYIEN